MGGTNSHVVIEEPPTAFTRTTPQREAYVLPLSARSDTALKNLADRYRAWLVAHPNASLADVCLTASTGRLHMRHRVALVARTREELVTQLTQLTGAPSFTSVSNVFYGVVKRRGPVEAFEQKSDPASAGGAAETAKAFADGAEISFDKLWEGGGGTRIALPTYPFERQRHWIDYPDMPDLPEPPISVRTPPATMPPPSAPPVHTNGEVEAPPPAPHPFLGKRLR